MGGANPHIFSDLLGGPPWRVLAPSCSKSAGEGLEAGGRLGTPQNLALKGLAKAFGLAGGLLEPLEALEALEAPGGPGPWGPCAGTPQNLASKLLVPLEAPGAPRPRPLRLLEAPWRPGLAGF